MEFRTGRAPRHGRRSKLDIVGDVLRVVSEGAEKPTNVMFRANLTWPLTVAYLELLLRHKMLGAEESEGKLLYRVTPKGSGLLRSFIEMEEGAAELELDRFDSAMVSKVISKARPTEGPEASAPLRAIQAAMEREIEGFVDRGVDADVARRLVRGGGGNDQGKVFQLCHDYHLLERRLAALDAAEEAGAEPAQQVDA
ncbi:MAG: hypothetical protein JRN08_07480, partial [Nitrososphaerota archaeon]|nr:hypothetical protein [Nitrososphaerota archaeon]